MSKLSLAKTVNGIRAILDVEIQADWEWYRDTIALFLEMSGYEIDDHVDWEVVNDWHLTEIKLLNWLNENTR